jgi:hypothetical protein
MKISLTASFSELRMKGLPDLEYLALGQKLLEVSLAAAFLFVCVSLNNSQRIV